MENVNCSCFFIHSVEELMKKRISRWVYSPVRLAVFPLFFPQFSVQSKSWLCRPAQNYPDPCAICTRTFRHVWHDWIRHRAFGLCPKLRTDPRCLLRTSFPICRGLHGALWSRAFARSFDPLAFFLRPWADNGEGIAYTVSNRSAGANPLHLCRRRLVQNAGAACGERRRNQSGAYWCRADPDVTPWALGAGVVGSCHDLLISLWYSFSHTEQISHLWWEKNPGAEHSFCPSEKSVIGREVVFPQRQEYIQHDALSRTVHWARQLPWRE